MRFSIFATLALAGAAVATPVIAERSLLTEIGSAVKKLEDGLGVTELEELLDSALGGTLSKLEDVLGVTFAEYLLGLSDKGTEPGVIQAIGVGVGLLLQGLGIDAVNALLDSLTNGAVTSLEVALGVPDLEAALGIA